MKKNQQYEINFTTNTIIVTKAFLQAASQTEAPEFKTMMKLRELQMPITVREIRRESEHRLSYKQMENYIQCVESSDIYLARYERTKQAQGYRGTWKWFKKCFPNYKDLPEFNDENKIIVTPADYPKDDAAVSTVEDAA